MRRMSRAERLAVHATLIVACVIAVFPVLWIVSTSFKPYEDVFDTEIQLIPETVTWENYEHVLTKKDGMFLRWMANSAWVALLTTLVGLFLSTTAAYALSRYKFYGRNVAFYALLVTQMFPGTLLLIPLYRLMNQLGLLDNHLGLVLAYATVAVPFCVMMLKGYFDTIPYELEEAAFVDGLGPIGSFWRIVLPLSLPGLAVTGFFTFITDWNEFLIALTFLSAEEKYTLPIGLQQFVNQYVSDYHYMASGAVIVTLPALVVFFLAQKWLVSGLTVGGVKG